jgi:hypothetical protein
LRTTPLWERRTKTRFMHDLKSESGEAINRHRDEARLVIEDFHGDSLAGQGASERVWPRVADD